MMYEMAIPIRAHVMAVSLAALGLVRDTAVVGTVIGWMLITLIAAMAYRPVAWAAATLRRGFRALLSTTTTPVRRPAAFTLEVLATTMKHLAFEQTAIPG